MSTILAPSLTEYVKHEAGFLICRPIDKPKFSPDEHAEQVALVGWLRRNKFLHHAIPNSGATGKARITYMVSEGLVSGVPDLYVMEPPGSMPTAIEMKRASGTPSDIKPNQIKFMRALVNRGWFVIVAFGARAATDYLKYRGL